MIQIKRPKGPSSTQSKSAIGKDKPLLPSLIRLTSFFRHPLFRPGESLHLEHHLAGVICSMRELGEMTRMSCFYESFRQDSLISRRTMARGKQAAPMIIHIHHGSSCSVLANSSIRLTSFPSSWLSHRDPEECHRPQSSRVSFGRKPRS